MCSSFLSPFPPVRKLNHLYLYFRTLCFGNQFGFRGISIRKTYTNSIFYIDLKMIAQVVRETVKEINKPICERLKQADSTLDRMEVRLEQMDSRLDKVEIKVTEVQMNLK